MNMYIENKHFYKWLQQQGHELVIFNKRLWFKLPGAYWTYYELKKRWFKERKKKVKYMEVNRISIEEYMKSI